MFSGISPTSLLLILAIVVLVFGTKKLKSLGSDVGGAIKGFRKSMSDDDNAADQAKLSNETSSTSSVSEKTGASQQQ